jgi:hypothetical protein
VLFQETQTNTGLVRKETGYSNPRFGITEPQRRILKAMSSGKGNYLIQVESIKGRKRYRCHDSNKNIVSNNFSKVVVKNLVSKGYLIEHSNKYFLK